MPKITIIVPVYKVEAYLHRCIDSILVQTFKDFQLILVNDGSPDQCPAICDAYEKKDNRIQVIHKKNGGLTSARLAGFRQAKGDYISFIDSDDYIAEDMIEKLYVSCRLHDSDLSMCGYYTVMSNNCIEYRLSYRKEIIEQEEINDNIVLPLLGKIFAKDYINVPGFVWMRLFRAGILGEDCFVSEREFFTEDDLLNLIIAARCKKISIVNEPLYYYWQNEQSLTNSYRKDAWNLLINRYYYCLDYVQKNSLSKEAKTRLHFNLFGSICYCIENAAKNSNSQLGINEIMNILNYAETGELLKSININLMRNGQKLLYIMCRCKMYWLLYWYKRMRVIMCLK
ncbi:putative glycosyltransferase EpsJ [Sporomusa silvacetica DSM 10669]|uniref:Glycosyltransferase EpsJ n=1 Tax=Sporomusa silvacetica DSM 10669 TaxID=1123289 RepID=A0ABZ3IH00_9FIRM|nr:glycosyltransferase family 2 protein [Sporomusa silvacetica]OZC21437.1 putative glycosyltransferase EpsJ [Sporomusa silvacetica DSM 10669]